MKLDPEAISEITEMIAQVRHDLRKPEATVKMFLDLLDEIKGQPDDLARWKQNVVASFKAPLNRLDEFEELIKNYSA